MKKFTNFLSKTRNEIVFSISFVVVLFLLFLPFCSLPFENETISISFLDGLMGNEVLINGTIYKLINTSILLWCGLISLILSELLILFSAFFKDKKIKLTFNSLALFFVIINLFIYMLSGYLVVPFDLSALSNPNFYPGAANPFGVLVTIFDLIMLLVCFSNIFNFKKYTIQEICETAILVALAVVLDQFGKIQIQANGGSISFSALPLFIIAIRYGAFKGFIASGFIFGFLTCLLDGYGFQTFPFDYLIALSGYGLVGTFYNFAKRFYQNVEDERVFKRKQFVFSLIAVILAGIPVMLIRYIGHMIDGALIYNYGFIDNLIYQSTYVPGAVWVSIAGMCVLLEPIIIINRIFPVKEKKVEENE